MPVQVWPGAPLKNTEFLRQIEEELKLYFKGELKVFITPIELHGTDFQKRVFTELQSIDYGKTKTYAEQAKSMGKLSAIRAIAAANGKNKIAIRVPCHRVIGSNGKLVGYSGGLKLKKWLIEHEQNFL